MTIRKVLGLWERLSTIQRLRELSGYRDSQISTQVWLTKNDDPTFRRQLTSSVSTIFASTICVLVDFRQFQINNRALSVICIKIY